MKSDHFERIFAYSDSIHDLPLLEFSDIPSAISPDKKLRKIAEERNSLLKAEEMLLVVFHRRTTTYQISISITLSNSSNRWPVFIFMQTLRR